MFPTRKYLGHVCPSRPKSWVRHLNQHMFLYSGGWGQAPFAPTGAHAPTRKCLGPLCPSGSTFLATLQSTAIFIFLRGKCPWSPPRWHPCPPQENTWVTCAPLDQNPGYATEISTCFYIQGVGASSLCPHGRPCPPPGNALAPCAPLVQNSWLHCSQQLFLYF